MSTRILRVLTAFAVLPIVSLASDLKVEASRAIKLAVVDPGYKAAGREPFHEVFADTLAYELGVRLKEQTPVKRVASDVERASWGLGNGIFDAALVIGSGLPRAMVSSDFEVLKATPNSPKAKFVLYFVIRKDDPALAALMHEVFPATLKGQFVLRAYAKQLGEEPDKFAVAIAGK